MRVPSVTCISMQQLLKIDKKMWINMTDEINIGWHRISGAKVNEILRKAVTQDQWKL